MPEVAEIFHSDGSSSVIEQDPSGDFHVYDQMPDGSQQERGQFGSDHTLAEIQAMFSRPDDPGPGDPNAPDPNDPNAPGPDDPNAPDPNDPNAPDPNAGDPGPGDAGDGGDGGDGGGGDGGGGG